MELRAGVVTPLEAARGLRRRAGRAVRRFRDVSRRGWPDEADLLRALGGRCGTADEAIALLLARRPIVAPDLVQAAVAERYAAHPGHLRRLLDAADAARAHRFDLLGSGPVDLGPRLPWHSDFKSGHAWDRRAWHEDLWAQVTREFGRGRDVKVAWELSRLQHLPLLGQAFWLTGDRSFYAAFKDDAFDFIASNPPGRGVNWTCTMDAALRALNLVAAVDLFAAELARDRAAAAILLRALLAHGRFVAAHLERADPAGNHYVADLVGLLAAGALFAGSEEGEGWRRLAASEIAGECARQTLADGADYEASTAYHRLMTEMYLVALLLFERAGGTPPDFRRSVGRMSEYAAHYLKPDGRAPQIGDNDDGRALVLGGHRLDRRDQRGLLGLAGAALGEAALVRLAGDCWEDGLWLCGPRALAEAEAAAGATGVSVTGAVYPRAGTAILRRDDLYVFFEAGPVGLEGRGAHAHNDTLSIEIQAAGEDLIVDPGTGGYTADLALRDRFRSTAAHNTVRVDGQEINPIPAEPFHLPGVDAPRIVRAAFRPGFDLVEAEHRGYARLPDPVVHRRIVLLNHRTRRVVIEDRLLGRGRHRLEWFFHLAPGVAARVGEDGRSIEARAGAVAFALEASRLPEGARLALVPSEFSPGYGRVVEAACAAWTFEGTLPVTARFVVRAGRAR